MRPPGWHPPIEPTPEERAVLKRIKRAKLFVFLRESRHELFDEEFQAELGAIYRDSPLGRTPVPPAQLALATILQAYTGVSDDEAIEAMVMDRRWQLALDCLDEQEPPFSKGTLVGFRKLLIEHELDRRLVERTVEVARSRRGGFGSRRLRAAFRLFALVGSGQGGGHLQPLGPRPKESAGRDRPPAGAGAGGTGGGGRGGTDRGGREEPESRARPRLGRSRGAEAGAGAGALEALDAVEEHLGDGAGAPQTEAGSAIETARRVREQDVQESADGPPALRRGVARERRVSVEDPEMRHGRKSRSHRSVDGYKRHVLRDLDSGLVRAVGVTPANAPEASVTDDLAQDLAPQGVELSELHIDRAYLSSELVRERPEHLMVYCKAWPVRNAPRGFTRRRPSSSTGSESSCAAQRGWRCPSRSAGWCASRRPRAIRARLVSAVRKARRAVGA
jgi:hypothetical protein